MRFVFLICCACLVFANEILLLSKFDKQDFNSKDFNAYLMSEKLDGVCGIWDGKYLKTRQNYKIKTPDFFTKNFPPFAIDGELWIARNKFDEISALIRSGDSNLTLWKEVTYNIFDVPNACEEFQISTCTLKNRLAVLEEYLQKYPSAYIKIIPQIPVENQNNLNQFYESIIKNQGEGIVIRKNLSPYEKGRSKNAMKLKPYDDAECELVGFRKGKGKFENQVGALLCKMPNGQIIKIGSGLKDEDRKNPPKIGSIVTYKFNGLTKNSLPRFPVF